MAITDKRSPWQDEFSVPSISDLRMDLPVPAAELFDVARDFLNAREGILESLRWYGDCWFWAVTYFLEGEDTAEDEPVAIIVPAPDNLQIAAPLDQEFVSQLNTRRMKRAIRDGLELASEPYSTKWAVWPVTAKNMLDEVTALLTQRMNWLQGT
ncbi:MAG: hypothetical protein QF561_01560 [Phycisphaerales bacterium]|jgi:hypothetical protein|nr:hypothetical protein [Phycisphaerales bacterium]